MNLSPLTKIYIFMAVMTAVCTSDVAFAQKPGGPAGVAIMDAVSIEYSSRKSFVGTLFPLRDTVVGSAVAGRVVDVLVEAGDEVSLDRKNDGKAEGEAQDKEKKAKYLGQSIVELRTGTLDIELKAAQIQYRLAQKTFEELELNLPADIKVAEAEKEQAESQLALTKTDYDMLQGLREKSSAVSEIEMQRSRTAFLAATQAARSARLQLEKLKSTQELQLARAELAVAAANQELVRLQDLRSKYSIRAPFEGVVIEKLTEVGAWVTQGSEVARIVQLDPIEIVLNVPQEFVGQLEASIERTVSVQFEGVDRLLIGKIDKVVPQLDIRSRTIPVRVKLKNPKLESGGYLLKPGMQGSASFAIGDTTKMTLVKKDALVLNGGQAHLFVVEADTDQAVARRVSVRTGVSVGEWIQVVGDVNDGDKVVVLGNERLRDGQQLKVLEEIKDRPVLEDGS